MAEYTNGHTNGNGNGNGYGNGRTRKPSDQSPAVEFDKLPPQNLEAELSVLGALLLDNETLHDVVPLLKVEDFYRDSHQVIYRAIRDLYDLGKAIDAITLIDELTRRGDFEKAVALHGLDSRIQKSQSSTYRNDGSKPPMFAKAATRIVAAEHRSGLPAAIASASRPGSYTRSNGPRPPRSTIVSGTALPLSSMTTGTTVGMRPITRSRAARHLGCTPGHASSEAHCM